MTCDEADVGQGERRPGRKNQSRKSRNRDDDAQAGPPARRPMVVRTPADLLAAVPVALGFVPSSSVVMLALAPAAGPHARIDLPALGEEELAAALLVEPALRHGVTRVALVIFADHERSSALAPVLAHSCAEAGVEVLALLGADGRTWCALGPGPRTEMPREYDLFGHRFVADAVVAGHQVLAARSELARRLDPEPAWVRAVEGARPAPNFSARRTRTVLSEALGRPELLTVAHVASLRRSLGDVTVRDACWSWARRHDAYHHLDLWIRVVRSCARREAASEAAVLAFFAWLAGDGAFAWCALDRAGEGGQETSLARLVRDLLERAVPPGEWSPLAVGGGEGSSPRAPGADTGAVGQPAEVVTLAEHRERRAGVRER